MKKRTKEILELLDTLYQPDEKDFLAAQDPGQLLIATILSAQCTDARVNMVTKDLFVKYPDMQAFADARLEELEQDILPTGFYHSKARNIIGCAREVCGRFGGRVPSSIEDLTSLPGVGRKTANVIRGHIFQEPSIVVDTHVGRISRRLGLTAQTDPAKVEADLMKAVPKEYWIRINQQMITFGRNVCRSRSPKCEICQFHKYCTEYKNRTGDGPDTRKKPSGKE